MIVRTLALLAALTCAAQAHIQLIEVKMSNASCDPGKLELLAGSDYELHFVSTANSSRDFQAPEFFSAATLAPDDRAKVKDGAVAVQSGATVDVRLTAGKTGAYKLRCAGKTGTVTVQ